MRHNTKKNTHFMTQRGNVSSESFLRSSLTYLIPESISEQEESLENSPEKFVSQLTFASFCCFMEMIK